MNRRRLLVTALGGVLLLFVVSELRGWDSLTRQNAARMSPRTDQPAPKTRQHVAKDDERPTPSEDDVDSPKASSTPDAGTETFISTRSNRRAIQASLKGTLTFPHGRNIVEFHVATGNIETLFEGGQAYRAENGETIFVPFDISVRIASADGRKITTFAPAHDRIQMNPTLSPNGALVAYRGNFDAIRHSGLGIFKRATRRPIAVYDAFPEHWTRDGRLVMRSVTGSVAAAWAMEVSSAPL